MSKYYTVASVADAWKQADQLMPTDYIRDDRASDAAGYPIYRSTVPEMYYCWISDLGDRLEVNLQDGSTVNVWIDEELTRRAEQDALDQIRCIVAGLNPEGYVATALQGCLDMAQENIEQQYCRSMMQERDSWQEDYQQAEKRAAELERWKRTMLTTLRALI